ncbi:hypothetical protein EMIHUDRAFT_471257 [Emiliania huxleyi CCMP1516]|uniref:Homeobox domain-containing protein n=2 Tax=Emiliania huxleyi TaxID=2903 RepID=A0A0D3I1D2_EMIH1|nr:hypothetical protein EMIHUDRAFT_471257 [Emiliania huxleyi CCMP1516]EOD05067.1 hypothetical protein EMIHUDRAFT_471257 [Emiliania huxleyi CCMP1516]|eukprot:XP_005757496.1 hypothetical protein EMIHUDRAFT_471257 [Emiliania huxleyi CCMP1516]
MPSTSSSNQSGERGSGAEKDEGATRRMQLSQDQRAVLEAVYAMEKLPDSRLRERLATYLSLSARQIQVWFQNRRQRSKSKEPQLSQPPLLAGHDQVLSALFDVSEGALPPEVRARVAMGSRCGTGGDLLASSAVAAGPAASPAAAAQLSAGAGGAMPLAAAAVAEEGAGRLPFNLSFEWGLPSAGAFLPSRGAAPSLAAPSLAAGLVPSPLDSLQPLPSLGGASVALGAVPATLGAACGREPHAAEPTSAAPPSSLPQSGLHAPAAPPGGRVGPSAPLAAAAAVGGDGGGLAPPPPMVLEAQMGYICHVLRLAAMDYSLVSASAPSSLLQTYAPDGAAVLNSLAWCLPRRLDPAGVRAARLFTPAGPLVDIVASTREAAWFGGSDEQAAILRRAGSSFKAIVGVPCLESPGMWGSDGQCVRPAEGAVLGVLVLYATHPIPQTQQTALLLSLLGSSIAAATLAAPAQSRTLSPATSYSLHPQPSASSALGWLLLVAARVADVAEHWRAELGSAGVAMSAERLLIALSVGSGPGRVTLSTGADSEAGPRPFSVADVCGGLFMLRGWSVAGGPPLLFPDVPRGLLRGEGGPSKSEEALMCMSCAVGVPLPLKTAVGIPLCSAASPHADALVLYSLRPLKQCPLTTNLLTHLQLLATAADVCSVDAEASAPDSPGPRPVAARLRCDSLPVAAVAAGADGGDGGARGGVGSSEGGGAAQGGDTRASFKRALSLGASLDTRGRRRSRQLRLRRESRLGDAEAVRGCRLDDFDCVIAGIAHAESAPVWSAPLRSPARLSAVRLFGS